MDKETKAMVAAFISFFLPGLGLLFVKKYMTRGVMLFFGVMLADVILLFLGMILTVCIIGLFIFILPLFLHIYAARDTYFKLLEG